MIQGKLTNNILLFSILIQSLKKKYENFITQQYILKFDQMKMAQNEAPTKSSEIDFIIQKALKEKHQQSAQQTKVHQRVHLMRAVFIAIDMTQSMHIRDIKPSRLGVTIQMMRKLVRTMKDITPLCKFAIAKVQNQLCKPLTNFTFSQNNLIEILDGLKLNQNAGFFSLQNTLSVALDYFETVPNTYHKELLIIQSSPFTKDYRDIYQTISSFQKSKISVNIGSLVGWTYVCQKLVESCHGQYITIGSQKQFEQFISMTAQNPVYNQDKVIKKLVKMSLSRREFANFAPEGSRKQCFCHYEPVQQYFVCGICAAVLCEKMPMQCGVCMATLVFPSDLFRHRN